MTKILFFICAFILMIGLSACEIKTPEIHGLVLDAETKKPVEEAWVNASMWLTMKTISGDVGQVISLEKLHTRTGKDGKFIIPSKHLKKPPFPISFGTKIDKFEIVAATLDKSGRIQIDLKELSKNKIETIIYLEDLEKAWQKELKHIPPEKFLQEKELREFSGLQAFYEYCFKGRFSTETTPIAEGCDEWELNYIIRKHEDYLKRYANKPENRSRNSIIFEQLGLLYEKKGDYEKALLNLERAKSLRLFSPKDIDLEIERIKQRIKKK